MIREAPSSGEFVLETSTNNLDWTATGPAFVAFNLRPGQMRETLNIVTDPLESSFQKVCPIAASALQQIHSSNAEMRPHRLIPYDAGGVLELHGGSLKVRMCSNSVALKKIEVKIATPLAVTMQ